MARTARSVARAQGRALRRAAKGSRSTMGDVVEASTGNPAPAAGAPLTRADGRSGGSPPDLLARVKAKRAELRAQAEGAREG
jgi:hypothetical protein